MRTHSPRTLAATVFGLVAGGVISVTIAAQAGDDEPLRTIPYSGYVDFDGQPVNAGAVKFNFALFPCATPGTGLGQCEPLWLAKGAWANGFPANQSVSLPIFSGRFSVELGADGQAVLPDEVFMSDYATLYLSIQIEGKTLGSLQKVTATPRAIASSEADRFRVRSEVAVDDPGAGGSALITADDGLVVSHSNPAQQTLLQVGAGATPSLVVSDVGASVSGGLTTDGLVTDTLAAETAHIASDAFVGGGLSGANKRVDIRGYATADDVIPSMRAGLVYAMNQRLDAYFGGPAGFVMLNGRPVLSLSGNGYLTMEVTARNLSRTYSNNTGWSIAIWFKASQATGPAMWVTSTYQCSSDIVGLYLSAARVPTFDFRGADDVGQGIAGTTGLQDTKWHQLVGVRDAPAGKIRLYVDGALAGEKSLTSLANHTIDREFRIGTIWSCGQLSDFFSGYLDDLRIYQRTLTTAEIADYYAASKPLHPDD